MPTPPPPPTGFGRFAVGGCNCGCRPCALPLSDLTLSFACQFTACSGGLDAGSVPFVYSISGGLYTWDSGCIALPSQSTPCATAIRVVMTCDPSTGITDVQVYGCSSGCSICPIIYEWNSASGVSGLAIGSYTCAPLNLPFTFDHMGSIGVTP